MKYKTHISLLLVSALLTVCTAASAQSALEGNWKPDPHSFRTTTKISQVLEHGTFHCACFPGMADLTIKVDGRFHPVQGIPYFDQAALQTPDDHTMELTGKRGGVKVAQTVFRVSADGKTAQSTLRRYDADGNVVNTRHGRFKRLGQAPVGAHAISGTWRPLTGEKALQTYQFKGNVIHASNSKGGTYSTRLGGKAVPFHGGGGDEQVAVEQLGPRVLREMFTTHGKPQEIYLTIINADGQHGRVVEQGLEDKHTSTWTITKQP